MPGVALLVFREVLEAALIISIICAATRDVPRRGLYVTAGIGIGIAGAMLVAWGAGLIAGLANGSGQELFNACVLLAAVVMIGWHVVWMSKHGRELAQHMGAIGSAVSAGSRSLSILLTVVALAVLREGSEIVLFLYGMAIGGIGAVGLISGIALGVSGGALLGFALYFGLLHVPMKHFFSVTNWMLVLLAAGLASTAARFLAQANLLPVLGTQLWDTSGLLSNGSLAGKTLGILIGYDASPAGIQVVFYSTTLQLLVAGMQGLKLAKSGRPPPACSLPPEQASGPLGGSNRPHFENPLRIDFQSVSVAPEISVSESCFYSLACRRRRTITSSTRRTSTPRNRKSNCAAINTRTLAPSSRAVAPLNFRSLMRSPIGGNLKFISSDFRRTPAAPDACSAMSSKIHFSSRSPVSSGPTSDFLPRMSIRSSPE